MPDIAIARESRELVIVDLTDDGAPLTDSFEVTITPLGGRPTTWETPTTVDTSSGILIGPGTSHVLTRGHYQVWARITSNPELPVIPLTNRIRIH